MNIILVLVLLIHFISFPRLLIRPLPPPCNRSSTPPPLPTHGVSQLVASNSRKTEEYLCRRLMDTKNKTTTKKNNKLSIYIKFNYFPFYSSNEVAAAAAARGPVEKESRNRRPSSSVRVFVYYSPCFFLLLFLYFYFSLSSSLLIKLFI